MSFRESHAVAGVARNTVIEAEINGNSYAICKRGRRAARFEESVRTRAGPLGQGNIADGQSDLPVARLGGMIASPAYYVDDSCKLASFPVKVEGTTFWWTCP